MTNKTNEPRELIAARLKEARLASGLSQEQAAEKIGLKRPAISEIESGKRKVTAEEIIQFAEMYKVNKAWLLLEEETDTDTERYKFAAREISKLSKDDLEKLFHVLNILPKR